ncbi:hypothetical protein HID58_075428 [Brassica napus]|uniref:Secreted protein n=1 Tax=Brassica napus TaxID=3708 RepID=A0ABQ7YMM3_BRANA|nr:hypothetical protein HID58_075428 [Brassica napus]
MPRWFCGDTLCPWWRFTGLFWYLSMKLEARASSCLSVVLIYSLDFASSGLDCKLLKECCSSICEIEVFRHLELCSKHVAHDLSVTFKVLMNM